MDDLFQRKGIVEIDNEFIKKDPDLVRLITSALLIVRAENLFMKDAIEYYAYSEEFDPIPDGQEAPRYNVVISTDADDDITVEFERNG